VRELDALRHFEDLVARGLIRLARQDVPPPPAAGVNGGSEDFI
jgi:hypothetical protein